MCWLALCSPFVQTFNKDVSVSFQASARASRPCKLVRIPGGAHNMGQTTMRKPQMNSKRTSSMIQLNAGEVRLQRWHSVHLLEKLPIPSFAVSDPEGHVGNDQHKSQSLTIPQSRVPSIVNVKFHHLVARAPGRRERRDRRKVPRTMRRSREMQRDQELGASSMVHHSSCQDRTRMFS